MILVLMGVSGVGKTTVGQILARDLGWSFYDADAFHSAGNIEKMRAGAPLTTEDRDPWLSALQELVKKIDSRDESAVLACSALTESFRRRLAGSGRHVRYVYLKNTVARLRDRLESRASHYMKAVMLESQLETLEEPDDALTIDIGTDSARSVANRIRRALDL